MTIDHAQADAYWMAIRGRACAACVDVADNACGLRSRLCALAAQLPLIAQR